MGAYQLTKLYACHISFRSPEREVERREYALSDAVLSVSWHGGSVCRRVVWFGFGYADVTTTGVLRTPGGPLAGLEGTEGDDNEGEREKQILWERAISVRPGPERVAVV